ncbi:MAG TPA: cysteine dioxygenase family protein [Acidobacteriota bacterium]|nr:cysteine dioxygenase family protein [Acidobacteriota bacterium]
MAVTLRVGTEKLIKALDQAVRSGKGDVKAATDGVKNALTELISEGQVELPEDLRRPRQEGYARRQVYRSPDLGYEVIAMVWGPGQGTPLHDHAGIWCVEGVYSGEIRVCQYELMEQNGDLYRFRTCDTVEAHLGESGSLIPPFEYHTIHNNRSEASSMTIHVYGKPMDHCHIFEPAQNEGWYRKKAKALSYD